MTQNLLSRDVMTKRHLHSYPEASHHTKLKVMIQIPCWNEEAYLPIALRDLPKSIPGVSELAILVVDDGSTDGTSRVAKENGITHLIRFDHHKGLAQAFSAGLRYALDWGADIIINTDADNQYSARHIPDLIRPILEDRADFVIGTRPIEEISDFSWLKKRLQKTGSWFIGKISGTGVKDATSGFRACNRRTALLMNIVSTYTYTVETILLAGRHNLRLHEVPVSVNPKLRDSRLARSSWDYLLRSSHSLLKSYLL